MVVVEELEERPFAHLNAITGKGEKESARRGKYIMARGGAYNHLKTGLPGNYRDRHPAGPTVTPQDISRTSTRIAAERFSAVFRLKWRILTRWRAVGSIARVVRVVLVAGFPAAPPQLSGRQTRRLVIATHGLRWPPRPAANHADQRVRSGSMPSSSAARRSSWRCGFVPFPIVVRA